MREVLSALGEEAPYITVGHSYGGTLTDKRAHRCIVSGR